MSYESSHAGMDGVEEGWLLDDGILCLGLTSSGQYGFVTYTDHTAIRFARKEDAERMKQGLMNLTRLAYYAKPVDHSWG